MLFWALPQGSGFYATIFFKPKRLKKGFPLQMKFTEFQLKLKYCEVIPNAKKMLIHTF
jgi:hypothetical protein